MILRKFEPADGAVILSWIKNEREFRMWSADRFGDYPITPDAFAAHYNKCEDTGLFFPFTAVDDKGRVVGHMILRYTDDTKTEVRFGFVIVDSSCRGKGLGREMLELAKKYAVDVLHAKKLSLGVFENNPAALKCYRSVGFEECQCGEEFFDVLGEHWKCIELTLIL
ncbi:MAG: GNAT family N-acetyltransferase [Ruminococcus sp.]|nr:GNAT family N-acetyltransferase [Ruminococcus sp.]